MVALKSLAHLSLSRPSSQSSTPRSPSSSSPAYSFSKITTRQTSNDDYYLSDDQLVSTGRVKSAGPTARSSTTDLGMLFTHPSTTNLSWAPQENPSVPPSALVLSSAPRSSASTRQHILMAPTPAVACGHAIQPTPHTSGAHRPLLSTLLSVSARGSPNCSRPISVDLSATPAAPTPKTQLQLLEASYVSKVGTRLKEVVNRIFPHNAEGELAFAGRMAPRPAAAFEFGEALKHDLSVSSSDSYISRAILRTAVIPALTVYIGRLDLSLLVPTMSTQLDPKALYYVPRNVKEVDTCLPLVLRYNIQVVKSAWAVRTAVEEICDEFSGWDDINGTLSKKIWVVQGLRGFVEKLDAIVHRFMEPYLVEIKALVMTRIALLRTPSVIGGGGAEQAGLSLLVKGVPLASSSGRSASPSSKFATPASWVSSPPLPLSSQHTSELVSELGMMLEGIRKLLMVTLACGNDSKKWMVSVASQAVWKAMLAFASRPAGFSPCSQSALGGGGVQQLDTAAIRSARHILRGGIKHHQSARNLQDSRPEYQAYRETAAQVKAFEGVVQRFVRGIAGLNKGANRAHEGNDCVYCKLGFSVDHDDEEGAQSNLVKEAMDEALIALEAFQIVSLGLLNPPQILLSLQSFTSTTSSNSRKEATTVISHKGCQTLKRAIEELPPLIFLHLLASRIVGLQLPHEIWGLSWKEYDEKLQGFSTGEIWCQSVGLAMWKELNRLSKVGNKVEPETGNLGASRLKSPDSSVSSTRGVGNAGIGHSGHCLGEFELLLEKSCALLL